MTDERTTNPPAMTNDEALQKLRRLMLTAIDVIDAHETGRFVWWEMVSRSLTDVAELIVVFCPDASQISYVKTVLSEALRMVRKEAEEADVRARAACLKSRYSMQDYHLCVEFRMQQLHDDLASRFHLPVRCPKFPFWKRVDEFRQMCAEAVSAEKDCMETHGTEG